MLLTIFTPIYNRAYCIDRLYNSLKRQACKKFEWIIVNDGSTDNINEVVNHMISENIIRIHYIHQLNSGKHTAINTGLKYANGELFFIVDSDDYIPEDAVEFIHKHYNSIRLNQFAGMSGIDITKEGTSLSSIKTNYIDSDSINIRFTHQIKGDLAEIFKTEILRKYLFPVVPNEKFCPEALVWNRIAKDGYIIRYFNKPLKIIEYLPDGLTSSIVRIRAKSPIASTTYYSELTQLNIPFLEKIKCAINYWRFWFYPSFNIKPRLSSRWLLAIIPGYLFYLKDKSKI